MGISHHVTTTQKEPKEAQEALNSLAITGGSWFLSIRTGFGQLRVQQAEARGRASASIKPFFDGAPVTMDSEDYRLFAEEEAALAKAARLLPQ